MRQNSNTRCNSSNTPCQKSPSSMLRLGRGEGLLPFCLFVRIRPKVIMVVLGKVASRYAKVITMDCIISHRNLCQFEQIGNRKFGQIIPVHHLNRKTQMPYRRSRPTQLFYLAQRVWLKMQRYVQCSCTFWPKICNKYRKH